MMLVLAVILAYMHNMLQCMQKNRAHMLEVEQWV